MKLLMLVAERAMAMLPMVAAQIQTHIEADEIVVIAPAVLKDRIPAVGGVSAKASVFSMKTP